MLDTINTIVITFLDEAPWWFYVLAILTPIFIMLALREGYCWFTKGSAVNKRLAKLDKTLNLILKELKNQRSEYEHQNTASKIIKDPNLKSTTIKSTKRKNSEFSLDSKEEFKLK